MSGRSSTRSIKCRPRNCQIGGERASDGLPRETPPMTVSVISRYCGFPSAGQSSGGMGIT